ncbi:MAG TPA: hypothetical protein VEB43_02670 [Anaeromyxobacter sp.]|nr:hypothetical protein [Anaeromyxobacter sp.]
MNDEQSPAPGGPASVPPGPGPMQRFRRIGVIVALVILVAFVGADLLGGLGAGLLDRLRGASLAPPEAVAQVQESRDPDALADLRRRFPRDPVVRLLSAYAAQDRAEAKEHLRAALQEKRTLRTRFPDGKLEAMLRSILASMLLVEGEDAEARAVIRPSCGAPLAGIADKAGLEAGWVDAACRG